MNLATAALQIFDIRKAVAGFQAAIRCSSDDEISKMAKEQLANLKKATLDTTPFKSMEAYLANADLFENAYDFLEKKQFKQSAELFRRVLAEFPTHVAAHGNLGLALAGLGQRSDALANLDRALELDPEYGPALGNRRIVAAMCEGEPLIPDQMATVRFYEEKRRMELD